MSTAAHKIQLTEGILQDILAPIGRLDGVDAIFAKAEGDGVTVWAVLADFSRENRDRLYAQEEEIIDRFSHIRFDFRALDSKTGRYGIRADASMLHNREREACTV